MRNHRPSTRFSCTRLLGSRNIALALVGAGYLMVACQSPTDSGGPAGGSEVDSVRIAAPSTLLVHDLTLLSVKAWKNQQQVAAAPVTWLSSNPAVASVRPSGTSSALLTAGQRGTVTITASSHGIAGQVTLRVTAQLRLEPDYILDAPDGWLMAVGEQLQLEARYVDVYNHALEEIPAVTWSSTNAAGVSVTQAGLVAATQALRSATITAAAVDDTTGLLIRVEDIIAGQPATLRLVHGIPGLGPIRFLISQGATQSLSYGESAELPILSGTLRVGTEGVPETHPEFGTPNREFAGVVRPGDRLTLYAAGNPEAAFIQPAWPSPEGISPDSGLVRMVQSSPAMVVYLRGQGAPIDGLPELCYFDPGLVSDYFARAAGDFDVIAQGKYDRPEEEIGRTSASVAGGHAVTLLLTGGGQQPLRVLTFDDR